MNDDVIDLAEQRRARATLYTCACGSTLWIAKVTIENDKIASYSDVVCNGCGQNR